MNDREAVDIHVGVGPDGTTLYVRDRARRGRRRLLAVRKCKGTKVSEEDVRAALLNAGVRYIKEQGE